MVTIVSIKITKTLQYNYNVTKEEHQTFGLFL
jgi:hypothetical protein